MAVKTYTEHGYIEFTDEVLANIAGAAAVECYGVVGMASKNATDGLWELLKRENINRGIKISSHGDEFAIDLYIIVEYGTKISVVANNIIQRVKYQVEMMTNLKVSKVTVFVQGIRI
jgi:uncharacterized alkaline shock family protein YloU